MEENSGPITSIYVKALAGGAASFLTTYAVKWLSGRSPEEKRNRSIASQCAEVKLLHSWLSARILLLPEEQQHEAREQIAMALDSVLARYLALDAAPEVESSVPRRLGGVRRKLLLYRPKSNVGWLCRASFFGMSAVALLVTAGMFADDEGNPSLGAFHNNIQERGAIPAFIFISMMLVGLYVLNRRVDQVRAG